MPTARQLELFVTVADAGSMRRAADLLGISQPSISKQIQALERNVGGELILRTRGGRAVLSKLGHELLEDARRSVEMHRKLVTRSSPPAPLRPRIYLRNYLLGVIKSRFAEFERAGLPRDTEFVISEEPADAMAKDGPNRNAFALFGSIRLPTGKDYVSHVVLEQSCSIYASRENAEKLACGELELADLQVLFPAKGFKLTPWLMDMMKHAGISPASANYGTQFVDLVMEEVANGAGISIFMDMHAHDLVKRDRLVAVEAIREPLLLVLLANSAVEPGALGRMCRALHPLRAFQPTSVRDDASR